MRRLSFLLLPALIAAGVLVTRHMRHDHAREAIRRSWEGRPAPSLEGVSLPALRGHPVLLFFWAHWCPDCKADVEAIAAVNKTYSPRGLVVLGPTQLYGYVAGGEAATPQVEKPYIEQIRRRFYAPLGNVPMPISSANFAAYNANTTPTIVLMDAAGVVRFYHPGAVSEAELAVRVQAVLP